MSISSIYRRVTVTVPVSALRSANTRVSYTRTSNALGTLSTHSSHGAAPFSSSCRLLNHAQKANHPRHWERWIVTTLRPEELKAKDIVDLSGYMLKRVNFARLGVDQCERMRYYSQRDAGGKYQIPFPRGTKGVLYFVSRPTVHAAAGEVRFRVLPIEEAHTPEDIDMADLFARGQDLLLPRENLPWHIHPLSIHSHYPRLRQFMLENGYLSPEASSEIQRLLADYAAYSGKERQWSRSIIVWSILDPFPFDFGRWHNPRIFFQKEALLQYSFPSATLCKKKGSSLSEQEKPYSGKALVRVELIRHGSHYRTVLRVLKFLEKPNPSDKVFQEEGQFLRKYNPQRKTEHTWMALPICPKWITPTSMQILKDAYLPELKEA